MLQRAAANVKLCHQAQTLLPWQRMAFATKIMGGSTNNKKDSAGRRLGIKKWGHTAEIFKNDILLKQRGLKWHPGMHVAVGKDHTLHAKVEVSHISNRLMPLTLMITSVGFCRVDEGPFDEKASQADPCRAHGDAKQTLPDAASLYVPPGAAAGVGRA